MSPALTGLKAFLPCLLLAGCVALPPGERDPRDPVERFNRSVYQFNDQLDTHLARPVAVGYVKVTPEPIRTGISNFFENTAYPATIVNSLLQAKFTQFASDTGRFVVNSTIGLLGLFDPATKLGLKANDEDLGQTLGYWGMPSGPFLMIPILGPSSGRDLFGDIADRSFDPKNYVKRDGIRYGLIIQELVDRRAGLLPADAVQREAFDPYAFMRNAYLQRREYQVKDGAVASEEVEIPIEEEAVEETAPAESADAAPTPPAAGN